MTLNIRLTSRNAVYLSGDFRLSKPDGSGFWDNHQTQKIVPVVRRHWSALVAYAGLASAPPIVDDVGAWILSQVEQIPRNAALSALSRQLLDANIWFPKIREKPTLEISVVGFEQKRPFMMLVSNFSTLTSVLPRVSARLQFHNARPKEAEIQLAGQRDSMTADELYELRTLVQHNETPRTVRDQMATANMNASGRNRSISRECVTGSLLPSGDFEIGPHGIPEDQPYMPGFVAQSLARTGIVGLVGKTDPAGKPLPIRWSGMSAASYDTGLAVVHAFSNVVRPVSGPSAPQNTTVFWKISQPNDPKNITFKRKSGGPETAASLAEYHSRVTGRQLSNAGRALSEAIAKGHALHNLVVIVAELSDPDGRRVVELSAPEAIKDGIDTVVLVEDRAGAKRLLAFNAAAAYTLDRPLATNAVKVACVTGGGVALACTSTRQRRLYTDFVPAALETRRTRRHSLGSHRAFFRCFGVQGQN